MDQQRGAARLCRGGASPEPLVGRLGAANAGGEGVLWGDPIVKAKDENNADDR